MCLHIDAYIIHTYIYKDIHIFKHTYVRIYIYIYKFEFMTHLFSHFFELQIRARLKFEVLFFILRKSRKHHFPRKRSRLTKRVVNFTDSEMYLLAKIFS
jgi:hypothetical protein